VSKLENHGRDCRTRDWGTLQIEREKINFSIQIVLKKLHCRGYCTWDEKIKERGGESEEKGIL